MKESRDMTVPHVDISRKDILARLPDGCKVKLNSVSFSGFGYGDAKCLTIYMADGTKVPLGMATTEQVEQYRDIREAVKDIIENFRFKDMVIVRG